jgi:hypothetical protein
MSIPILTSDSAALPERAVQSVVRQAFEQLAAGRAAHHRTHRRHHRGGR